MIVRICHQCQKGFKGRKESKFCNLGCKGLFYRGKPLSQEQKIKLSLVKQGYVPWNKGLGKPRKSDVRKTRIFKNFRISILIKSSYRCSECGNINGRLEIDHIKPVKFFPELVLDENNVRILCRECHKKTPTYGTKVFNYEHSK